MVANVRLIDLIGQSPSAHDVQHDRQIVAVGKFPGPFGQEGFGRGFKRIGRVGEDELIVLGAARERGELIWLEHADERRYDTTFRILTGDGDIAAAERRITSIQSQPDTDYPEPSGNHLPIKGRA